MSSHDDIRIRQITLARPGLYTAAGSLLSIQISSTISPEEIPAQEDSESPEERQTAETEAEAEADQSSGDVQNDDQNDLGVYMCRLHSKGPITEHHTTLFRYGGGGEEPCTGQGQLESQQQRHAFSRVVIVLNARRSDIAAKLVHFIQDANARAFGLSDSCRNVLQSLHATKVSSEQRKVSVFALDIHSFTHSLSRQPTS